MVNILGLASVIWLAMCLRRRFPTAHSDWYCIWRSCATVVSPGFLPVSGSIPTYQVVTFFKQPVMMVGAMAFLALILWQHQLAARIAAVLVAVLSPLAFFTPTKTCCCVLI